VALLAEISAEKLVIVVTHSAKELEAYATREVRIFDGSIERDERRRAVEVKELPAVEKKCKTGRLLRRSAELGLHRFRSVPKLSAFMCTLMVIALLATFFATALTVSNLEPLGAEPMFTHLPGRVVLVRQDAAPMTEGELNTLAATVGAGSVLQMDALLDHRTWINYHDYQNHRHYYASLAFTNDRALAADVGRLPEGENEALLELPIAFADIFGRETLLRDYVDIYGGAVRLDVVGVRYYYDNTRPFGRILLTEEGFARISAADYVCGQWRNELSIQLELNTVKNGYVNTNYFDFKNLAVDPALTGNEIAVVVSNDRQMQQLLSIADSYTVNLLFAEREHDHYTNSYTIRQARVDGVDFDPNRTSPFLGGTPHSNVNTSITAQTEIAAVVDGDYEVIVDEAFSAFYLAISPELAKALMQGARGQDYTQASLFFASDDEASGALDALREAGYLPVLSSSTYISADSLALALIENALLCVAWLFLVVFFAIFVALCSTRAMAAKRGDLAILRSMGIPNRIIKCSSYVQTALATVPAILLLAVTALLCYRSPRINPNIPFLHAPQYIMILVGMLLICLLVTHWHNRRMFRESVRRTLKGGEAK
jgi:hypothetical protein